jgi:hypothetical protein
VSNYPALSFTSDARRLGLKSAFGVVFLIAVYAVVLLAGLLALAVGAGASFCDSAFTGIGDA